MLRHVDVTGIQDERARECIGLWLNLIESLTAALRKSQAENVYLREQPNRRKGGGGKPDQPKDTAGAKPQSSENERAEPKQRTRLVLGGNGQVAGGEQLAAGRGCHAMHLGDDRLRNGLDPEHELAADVEDAAIFADIAAGHFGKVVA
jgi:hypothetical protein